MAAALIGRDHPAGLLRAEISRATDSHGGLVLVTGEAGIGKTTLVTGAVEEARRLGALVLSGSCWDSESAPGYWPWVQVIRGMRRTATPEEWAEAESAAGWGVKVLLGESPGTEAPDGFQLYDAVTTALVSVSQRRPVVVVLDDLHWADTASVKLLEFAAQHTWFERLLLVGTYRDVEVEWAEHPLRSLMQPLVAKATTVTLTGLGRAEVGALMTRTVGQEPDEDMVTEVHRRTGGNPFFVEQTARLWRSGGSISAIAPGVRDAVQRRLSLLAPPVTELLTAAAVLGREFHRKVLAATVAAPVPHVDRLLDQAISARLMVTAGGGRFAFAHDLVRETLYDALDEESARHWHAAVLRALDRSSALTERVLPAELARHAHLAGDEIEPARAVGHLRAAARHASGRLAYDESVGHYRRALERAEGDTPRRRAKIALDLAKELHHVGGRDEAWQFFELAVAINSELDDPELLARIALTLYGYKDSGERGRLRGELLDQAHRTLVRGGADAAGPLSADFLAQELTIRITGLARSGEDDDALSFSLWARHDAIWGPGTAAEREALTREMLDVARRTGDDDSEFFATSLRWVALLEMGDPRYLDQYHDFVKLTARADAPRWLLGSLVDQSIINTHLGRFAEAQSLIEEVETYEGRDEAGEFVFMTQHIGWVLWMLQGRFEELDGRLRLLEENGHPYPRLMAAILAVERGDLAFALRHLAEFVGVDEPYPRAFAPLWLRFQAQTAAASRDPELCERARAALAPFAGLWMVAVYGCDVGGPVALWSGLLDAAQERWDDAIGNLTAAQESAERLALPPWSIEARAYLAQVLLARDASGDSGRAQGLLADVEREATVLGMRQVVERARRMRSGGEAAEPAPVTFSANVFRFDGQVWTLSYGGQTVHMPDAKGLRDLHLLLGSPGTEIPAVRLLNPEGGEVVVAARQMGGDAVLDEEAKAQYKRRLDLLDEQIDRAAELGDDSRAAGFDRERQALLNELRAAAGLAGRSRRLGDEAERARKTVTARIRDTLRKLDQGHPSLGAHLRATVSTGATCLYRPDDETTWRL